MAATQLGIYNEALTQHLGERKLASITASRESRRVMDDIWTDAVKHCLEEGLWNFAIKKVELEYDDLLTPDFGMQRVVEIPTDHVRTVEYSADEMFSIPLSPYVEEAGYIYSNTNTIYLRYVSNHADFGGNTDLWPESFKRLLAVYMAWKACYRITQSRPLQAELQALYDKEKVKAIGKDMMAESPRRMPHGRWVSARMGGSSQGNHDLTNAGF